MRTSILVLAMAATLAGIVQSGTATASPEDVITAAPAAKSRAASTAAVRSCSNELTGSRIRRRPGECAVMPVRMHSEQDILSTGQINMAEALRRLNVAFF